METKQIKAELDLEELEICLYSLKHDLIDSIKTHYRTVQKDTAEQKRQLFLDQEAKKLDLLKLLSGLFPGHSNAYIDVLYDLNNIIHD